MHQPTAQRWYSITIAIVSTAALLAACTTAAFDASPTLSSITVLQSSSPLDSPAPSTPTAVLAPCDGVEGAAHTWLTYLNHNRGIELCRPERFVFIEDEYARDVAWLDWSVVLLDKAHQQNPPRQAPGIAIHAYPNPQELDPADWLLLHSTQAPFGSEVDGEPPVHYLWDDAPIRSVTVAGREGIEFAKDAMGLRIGAVLLPHEPWMLEITFGDFGPVDLEPVFRTILETLRLTTANGAATLIRIDVLGIAPTAMPQ